MTNLSLAFFRRLALMLFCVTVLQYACGCERIVYYEYVFSDQGGDNFRALPADEEDGYWKIGDGAYSIYIGQRKAPNQTRLHIVTVNNAWESGDDTQDHLFFFKLEDYSSCSSRLLYYEELGDSTAIFRNYAGMVDFHSVQSEASYPGLSAILIAEPCSEEKGWLDFEVYGPNGESLGTRRVFLGFRVSSTSWEFISDF